VGKINRGILALIGVEKLDNQEKAEKLIKKIISYRIFADDNDKMNLSLQEVSGELLLVSQFTLVADTNKGLRPSFSSAGSPQLSQHLYEYMIAYAKTLGLSVQAGVFAVDMQVSLVNDGPVTFNLQC
jgi:D-tyrosyl-tRNA(Tyr) deacylase